MKKTNATYKLYFYGGKVEIQKDASVYNVPILFTERNALYGRLTYDYAGITTGVEFKTLSNWLKHKNATLSAFKLLPGKNPVNKIKKRNPVKKKRVRKNPVSTYIKVFRHGQGDKTFSQKGYFTGIGWNTEISKAKKYSAGEAKKLAMQLKIPEGWGVAIVNG